MPKAKGCCRVPSWRDGRMDHQELQEGMQVRQEQQAWVELLCKHVILRQRALNKAWRQAHALRLQRNRYSTADVMRAVRTIERSLAR